MFKLAVSHDGRQLAISAFNEPTIRIYSTADCSLLSSLCLYEYSEVATSLCFSSNGEMLAACNNDSDVFVFRVKTEACMIEYHHMSVSSVCMF